MRNKRYELREQKRKVKKQIRRTRKELLELEDNLHELDQQYKVIKQIELNKKHKESLLARARKGEFRMTKQRFMKIIEEAA